MNVHVYIARASRPILELVETCQAGFIAADDRYLDEESFLDEVKHRPRVHWNLLAIRSLYPTIRYYFAYLAPSLPIRLAS